MRRKINILTSSYTVFLALLFLSGSLSGILEKAVYYLSFILPIGLSLYLTRGDGVEWKKHLTIDKDGIKLSLPLIFPTVSVTILISFITSLIIFTLTGKTSYVDVGDSYFLALLTHALVPAVFEEALFRYLPMRLLAPHSPRCAIIVSAFFFALVHHDLFSIPYAFFGGVIFMMIDLATESVIPSVIIHFINNAMSISMMFMDPYSLNIIVYLWLALITVFSVIIIYKNIDEYKVSLLLVTEKGEGVRFTPEMILFAVITLAIAVISLF